MRIFAVLLLCVFCASALEPGKPSKTSVWVLAARAIGARDPDPTTRNPDWLADPMMGPSERAILPDNVVIQGLGKDYREAMKDPETIEIGARRSPAETVKHVIYPVSDMQKTDLLLELLKRVNYDSVIIFCRTKHGADRVAHTLQRANHAVAILHSNRTQREREEALDGFRRGKFEVLVATDIAARGLDIANVSHVINYDVPQHPEDYVHRIGRTGRAENTGDAFTIMVAEDAMHVFSIERFIGQKIPREKLEGFDYRYTALFEADKPGAAKPHERKVQMVRIGGGYFFGARKRRR